jgi:hypothetical protein
MYGRSKHQTRRLGISAKISHHFGEIVGYPPASRPCRVGKVGDTYRNVYALFQQVYHSVKQYQVDPSLGIASEKTAHCRCHMHFAKAYRRGQRDQPAGLRLLLTQGTLCLLYIRDDSEVPTARIEGNRRTIFVKYRIKYKIE